MLRPGARCRCLQRGARGALTLPAMPQASERRAANLEASCAALRGQGDALQTQLAAVEADAAAGERSRQLLKAELEQVGSGLGCWGRAA